MKDFTVTKVHYTENERDKDGVLKTYITSETAFNKATATATANKEELPTLLGSQTFGFRAAETVDEAVQLCGGNGVGEYENIEVFLGVFNYAATLRQHNAANDVLQSDNFVPQEGVWDISSAVAEKVERAKMTPAEKAVSILAKGGIKISTEQLQAALASILAQQSQSVSA